MASVVPPSSPLKESTGPKTPWRRSSLPISQTQRDLRRLINKWSNDNLEQGAKTMRAYLISHPGEEDAFIEQIFASILQYTPVGISTEGVSNPMIQLYVDHLANIIRPSDPSKENCSLKSNVFFPESLSVQLKSSIFHKTCAQVKLDFDNKDFKHHLRGSFYIMVAKLTREGIISVDNFSVLCLAIASNAKSDQQRLAMCDLVLNGWEVLHQNVREMIRSHCRENMPNMQGKAKFLYMTVVECGKSPGKTK